MTTQDKIHYIRRNLARTESPKYWIYGRNRRLNIRAMTITHIKSCLEKCEANNFRTQFIPIFKEEIALREKYVNLHNEPERVDALYEEINPRVAVPEPSLDFMEF